MNTPLFERQATGGGIARKGFEYQNSFILEHIPLFLSQGAFSLVVSEVLGDIEVRYFRPGGGTSCVFYEAKGEQLTKAKFWAEVERFMQVYQQAPDEYLQFVLVCKDFANEFQPLLNRLERLRGLGGSLNADSVIRSAAENEIVDTVVKLGQTKGVGRFVLERVTFTAYDDTNVDAGFGTQLERNLPLLDLSRRDTSAFRDRCRALVAESFKGPVTRLAIEQALVTCAPAIADDWLKTPTVVELGPPTYELGPLGIDITAFNAPSRVTLGPSQWAQAARDLDEVGSFVHATRRRRGIRLMATNRMSTACMLGFYLSATKGFTLQLDHRGQVFDTAIHDKGIAGFFTNREENTASPSLEGVAVVGFPSNADNDVQAKLASLGLNGFPKLVLESTSVVADIASLNIAVAEAKAALADFRSRRQLTCVHLFIKAPSMFATALGHRLNGVGRIQLYDWDQTSYVSTVQLS